MADIFISYSRQDRNWVAMLAKSISRRGYALWWDPEIPPGVSFDDHIEIQLSAAKCIIVVWSKASIFSRWVKLEATEGLDRNILVPVLMEKVKPPLAFRGIQAVDLSEWDGRDRDTILDVAYNRIESLLANPSAATSDVRSPGPVPDSAVDGQLKNVSIRLKVNKIYNDKIGDFILRIDDSEVWNGSLIAHDGWIYTARLKVGDHTIAFSSNNHQGTVTRVIKVNADRRVGIQVTKSWWNGAQQIDIECS